MGQTRAKKPSKRSLKAQQELDARFTSDLNTLSISNVTATLGKNFPATLPSPGSNLTPAPSNKTSRDSMKSAVSMESTNQKCENSLLDVKETENRGLAAFAKCRIPAGILLLAEIPIVRLTREHEETGVADDFLESSFAQFPKISQKSFLSLFDSEKARFSRVKSIYYSNCYNLDKRSQLGGSCIGLIASRINHSCLPNAQLSFDDAEGTMLFYSLKNIPKGKEICTNYDTVFDTRDQRQRKQMLHYGFRCDCEACEQLTDFWTRSDERRLEMIRARRSVRESENKWQNEGLDGSQITSVIMQLEKMESAMIKEGLFGDPLVNVYKSLTKWSERARDYPAMRRWGIKELSAVTVSLGEQSARAHAIRDKLEGLKS